MAFPPKDAAAAVQEDFNKWLEDFLKVQNQAQPTTEEAQQAQAQANIANAAVANLAGQAAAPTNAADRWRQLIVEDRQRKRREAELAGHQARPVYQFVAAEPKKKRPTFAPVNPNTPAPWAVPLKDDPPTPKEEVILYRTPTGQTAHFYKNDPSFVVRGDGRVEQVCSHGVGHPVGITGGARWDAAWMGVHGCCGCCRTKLGPGDEETRG